MFPTKQFDQTWWALWKIRSLMAMHTYIPLSVFHLPGHHTHRHKYLPTSMCHLVSLCPDTYIRFHCVWLFLLSLVRHFDWPGRRLWRSEGYIIYKFHFRMTMGCLFIRWRVTVGDLRCGRLHSAWVVVQSNHGAELCSGCEPLICRRVFSALNTTFFSGE